MFTTCAFQNKLPENTWSIKYHAEKREKNTTININKETRDKRNMFSYVTFVVHV
jgi:hypothetical protein